MNNMNSRTVVFLLFDFIETSLCRKYREDYLPGILLCDIILDKKNEYEELFAPSRSILTTQLPINIFESTIGLLTPSTKRCPHLGCALKWNSAEHSWDCPCHGSRFTEDGELINNPATNDLKEKSR